MNKQTISLRLAPAVLEELKAATEAADMPQTDWITEAIREKLARVAAGSDRLMGLPKQDCDLVWKLVACLKKAPKASGFRRAVKANFDWLLETIEE